ncbi:uncharacterized protein CIMG_13761 [Coccidioides immitis RS]|uniref:Uncharacterized protein n=1 Tax=Coccidioides immitis (strain RS) TaxID=246410 RepID=A0A0D8JW93_COCIM|nr:uncharacterized protein CIMG_13761 [Coccidioides immitis RS]KJF61595.1 hypothetical protein CIMG_13761 [Coccidioides immitis RS]
MEYFTRAATKSFDLSPIHAKAGTFTGLVPIEAAGDEMVYIALRAPISSTSLMVTGPGFIVRLNVSAKLADYPESKKDSLSKQNNRSRTALRRAFGTCEFNVHESFGNHSQYEHTKNKPPAPFKPKGRDNVGEMWWEAEK